MNALEFLSSRPWCIQPESLETLIAFAERQPIERIQAAIAARENTTVEAVRSRVGRPMDGVRNGYRRGPVCVIEVVGPIIPRAELFSDVSGMTSLDTLASNLQAAMDDPTVQSVVLAIDSPGGQANGVAETAAMIRAAGEKKPVCVYVEGTAASAAYWLASAASEIVMSPTSIVGSIGTVMVADTKKKDGRVEIVSSQSPHKRPDLATESGRGRVQMLVDQMTEVFVADVASYRGVDVGTVLSDFGQGDVILGRRAIDAGMADRLGSLESLITELSSGAWPGRPKPKPRAEANRNEEAMTISEFRAMLAQAVGFGGSAQTESPHVAPESSQETAVTRADIDAAVAETQATIKAKDDQIAQLTARLQGDGRDRAKAGIKAFLDAQVKLNCVVPAERDGLESMLLQAAADDAASPLASGSRLEQMQASISARRPHDLTSEGVPANDGPKTRIPEGSSVLPADAPPPPSPDAPAASAEMEKLLSLTPLGKTVLKATK